MEIVQYWVANNSVRLHVIESDGDTEAGVPLVFIPGGLGAADDYLAEFETFDPRRCLAMSLRGQGKSDVPDKGYAFSDFVGDIETVMLAAGLDKPCLLGYSMGAPMAIEYAARYPEAVSGLIIGDYPAQYPKLSPAWVDSAMFTLGRLADKPIIKAIQAESEQAGLWERLPQISCPVLILRGGLPDAKLNEADADKYRQLLPQSYVITFPRSGHALWEPDYNQFITTVRTFLRSLDLHR